MKKTIFAALTLMAMAVVVVSCQDDDSPTFTATTENASLSFLNVFAANYTLSEQVGDNVAERFVWNTPDLEAPVNLTYQLLASTSTDSASFELIGATTTNDLVVSVSDLIEFATELGLDGDPETTNPDGTPNNTGVIFVRLRAFTGTDAANSMEVFSAIQPLNVTWAESTAGGGEVDPLLMYPNQIYAVGAATPGGWNWVVDGDSVATILPFIAPGIFQVEMAISNETFRFFPGDYGDWGASPSMNFPFFEEQGYSIPAVFENAADGDSNLRFIGTPGTYTITVNAVDKTITVE